ncbi:DUF4333 domain-containing protein [Aeromicrobium sp. YC3-14]|nr:DUF4333 domain-containing protein [Aeromicrobium stalagmiti]
MLLDPSIVEKDIAAFFAKEIARPGDSLSKVSCPDEVSGAVGDETTCDVDFSDGAYGNLTIKIVNAKGKIKVVGLSRSVTQEGGA